MNIQEFKKMKPEYKDVEGEQLWNAMEDYMLTIQQGDEVIKQVMPIWKTHTLRWLFYRRKQSMMWSSIKYAKWSSTDRCNQCKKGVNAHFSMLYFDEEGKGYCKSYCPNCGKEYKPEPNTNMSHKLWNFKERIIDLFWIFLDRIHLVRSSYDGRYGMMGDESRYVQSWSLDMNNGKMSFTKKKRKLWEYILIEKRFHNF